MRHPRTSLDPAAPDAPQPSTAQRDRELSEALAALERERLAHAHTVQQHQETLALLAHDLRSPLLTLNLNLEMLRLKPHTAEELEARREVMKRQADQLKALAAGLLKGGTGPDPASAAAVPSQD